MFYVCLTSIPANRCCSHFDQQWDEEDSYVDEGYHSKAAAEQMLKFYEEEYDATGYVWERK